MNRRERSLTSITLTVASSITWYCLAPLAPVRGQITPDSTLGTESSIVTPNVKIKGTPSDRILTHAQTASRVAFLNRSLR